MIQTPTDEYGRQVGSGQQYTADLTGRAKIMDRIQKILSMTRSPNEAEAASAATMLQRMLEDHNLSMADLEAKGAKGPGVREKGHDLGKAAFKWKMDLAEGIAEFYYCAPLVDRKAKTVAFVGRPENVDALTALYSWVIEQIRAIATTERRSHIEQTGEHIDPLRWQLGFGEGAVERLVVRLKEMKARQQEDMSRDEMGNVTAMVLYHQAEVSDYLEEKFGYRTDGKKTKRELEWEEAARKRNEVRENLRAECEATGDMEPFYSKYPWERPETPEQEAARLKIERKRVRARRRSSGGTGLRRSKRVDWDKVEQSSTAHQAGREAASKINLQPFVSGRTEKGKLG